ADKQMPAAAAFFIPTRGQIRAVAQHTSREGAMTPSTVIGPERAAAKQSYEGAGDRALCGNAIGLSFTRGELFRVHPVAFSAVEAGPYVPPRDRLSVIVTTPKYIQNASGGDGNKWPSKKLVGDLILTIGVKDEQGSVTPISGTALQVLGLVFDKLLPELLAAI